MLRPPRIPLALRKALQPLLDTVPVRIRSGPNEGARWSLSVSGRHRAGTFEVERVSAILSLLQPGDCFWDIGAHHGYVSLAASRRVGPEGHVYSFEPSGYNYMFLERHIQWNAGGNTTPVHVGLAAEPGWADFGGSGSSVTFRIGGGTERTKITSIEELMRSGYRAPDVLKIDAEGAEGEILRDGAKHLPAGCALAVSIHSHEEYRICVEALRAAGFTMFGSEDVLDVRYQQVWMGDPDVIAVGPECTPPHDPALLPGFAPL